MTHGSPADTRTKLLRHARALFAERGFAGTAIEEAAAATGITRRSFHYHFADKLDLFRTVFEELASELVMQMDAAAADAPDAGAALRARCHAWLDASLEPAIQRVLLLDGPTVLGWEEWRRIDARHGLRSLREALEAAMDAGMAPRQPARPLSILLAGALNEAALEIALAPDRRAARRAVGRGMDTLLDGLRRMALT